MAQKFYVASRGNSYLTLAEEPGEVTEDLVVRNIHRMMEMDDDTEDMTWSEIRTAASTFYEENIERILAMAHLHEELVEISKEQAEELENLSFEEWMAWEFADAEWD